MKQFIIAVLLLINVFSFYDFTTVVTPVGQSVKFNVEANKIKSFFKVSDEILDNIFHASAQTGLNPMLLACLAYTESRFNPNAVSKKGYHGVMQIPWKLPYTEANILIGAKILNEKLRITKGDLLKALALYKGGNNPVAYTQAKVVYNLYKGML